MTEDEKRDRYYRKKYGVGLDWYEARLARQGWCCGICKRPQELFTKRLAIDHCHKIPRLKIWTKRLSPKWWSAGAELGSLVFHTTETKKTSAIRIIRAELKVASCRGLLCPFCNRGLRYYADDPNRLANASEYLKRHQNQ